MVRWRTILSDHGLGRHRLKENTTVRVVITEMVNGKSVTEALEISNKAVVEALDGLPAVKVHCSVLAEEALKSAIEDYLGRSKKQERK